MIVLESFSNAQILQVFASAIKKKNFGFEFRVLCE